MHINLRINMKKVLFSISLLWTFANADAMQPNQQTHACPFSNRTVLAVGHIDIADTLTDLGKVAVHCKLPSNRPDYTYITDDIYIADGIYIAKDTIYISNDVRESPYFANCKSIRRVIFGPGSNLELIDTQAFAGTNIEVISIPDSVIELGNRCFEECYRLRHITFGLGSQLKLIGTQAFASSMIEEINIPNSVRVLGKACFYSCKSLRRVIFLPGSNLELIGPEVFAYTSIEEVSIPDSVRELGDRCFYNCRSLRHVIFGPHSALEHIGEKAFYWTPLVKK